MSRILFHRAYEITHVTKLRDLGIVSKQSQDVFRSQIQEWREGGQDNQSRYTERDVQRKPPEDRQKSTHEKEHDESQQHDLNVEKADLGRNRDQGHEAEVSHNQMPPESVQQHENQAKQEAPRPSVVKRSPMTQSFVSTFVPLRLRNTKKEPVAEQPSVSSRTTVNTTKPIAVTESSSEEMEATESGDSGIDFGNARSTLAFDAHNEAWALVNSNYPMTDGAVQPTGSIKHIKYYDPVLRPKSLSTSLENLQSDVVDLCWIREMLPTENLTFFDAGLSISMDTLFGAPLFKPESTAMVPSSWVLAKHRQSQATEVRAWSIGESEQIQIALTAIIAALQLMIRRGYLGEKFFLIALEMHRKSIASVRALSNQSVLDVARGCHNEGMKVESNIEQTVSLALAAFGLRTNLAPYSPRSRLRAYARLLALVLVSYSGSHRKDFRQIVWTSYHANKREPLVDNATLYLQKQKLACLNPELGGPVYMFGTAITTPRGLSASYQDYVDLWGPVWTAPSPYGGDSDDIIALHTEKGMIYRQEKPHEEAKKDEVTCHWISTRITQEPSSLIGNGRSLQLDTDGETDLPDKPLSFSKSSRLLIGHPVVPGGSSTLTMEPEQRQRGFFLDPASDSRRHRVCDRMPTGMSRNTHCELVLADLANSKTFRMRPAGTKRSRRKLDAYAAGLNLGHSGTGFTSSWTYKRDEGITRKQRILSRVAHANTSISYMDLLSLRLGLGISTCTWVAERLTLWDALKLASIQRGGGDLSAGTTRLDQCCELGHRLGDPNCILTCFTLNSESGTKEKWESRLAHLSGRQESREDFSSTGSEKERTNVWEQCLTEVIPELLASLGSTGVDEDGNMLQVLCPFDTNEMIVDIPTADVPWIEMLKDTENVATFAVFQRWCTVFKGRKEGSGSKHRKLISRCQSRQWKEGNETPQQPVLQTVLTISKPDLMFGGRKLLLFDDAIPIGVPVEEEMPLHNGGSLLFQNEDPKGQLACYHPVQRMRKHAETMKEKWKAVRGKQSTNLFADELRDDPLGPQYHIKVYVY